MNKKLIKFLSIGGILVGSTVLSTNYVAKANTTIASVQNYDREEMINYLLSHSVPEEKKKPCGTKSVYIFDNICFFYVTQRNQ